MNNALQLSWHHCYTSDTCWKKLSKKIHKTLSTWLRVNSEILSLISWSINQKQPSRGVLWKQCSENRQQIYRRTLMPKCDFNKVAKQLYWNHISAWVVSVNLLYKSEAMKWNNAYWIPRIIIYNQIGLKNVHIFDKFSYHPSDIRKKFNRKIWKEGTNISYLL